MAAVVASGEVAQVEASEVIAGGDPGDFALGPWLVLVLLGCGLIELTVPLTRS